MSFLVLFSLFCSHSHHLLLALTLHKVRREKYHICFLWWNGLPHVSLLWSFALLKDRRETNVKWFLSHTHLTRYILPLFLKKTITCKLKLRRHDELFSLQWYKDWTCLCLAWFPPEKPQSTLVFSNFKLLSPNVKCYKDLMVELIKNKTCLEEEWKKREYFTKIGEKKLFCCFSDIIVTKYNLFKYFWRLFFLDVWILQWTTSIIKVYTDLLRGLGLMGHKTTRWSQFVTKPQQKSYWSTGIWV